MVLALPGGRGLFNTLQVAIQQREGHHCIHLGMATHDFLDDFHWLANEVTSCPT